MKKIGWGIAAVVLVTVFSVLFLKSVRDGESTERTLFLFDTQCTVTAYGENSEEAVEEVFERLSEIHYSTSFYSKNSEVSKINSAKAGEEIQISEDMTKILEAAIKVSEASEGAFDITVAPVVELWDFSGRGRVPEGEEIQEMLVLVGSGKLLLDTEKMTVTKTHDGVKIDLGGAAKGYAGDAASEILKKWGVSGGIVDLGGNISCVGTNPNSDSGKWRIGLQKPFAPAGEVDEVIEVGEGAVITSGTYQRYFEKDGKKYHHIIDPQTGYPAEGEYDSVTLVLESSLFGDCLATACFVADEDSARELAQEFGAEIYFK